LDAAREEVAALQAQLAEAHSKARETRVEFAHHLTLAKAADAERLEAVAAVVDAAKVRAGLERTVADAKTMADQSARRIGELVKERASLAAKVEEERGKWGALTADVAALRKELAAARKARDSDAAHASEAAAARAPLKSELRAAIAAKAAVDGRLAEAERRASDNGRMLEEARVTQRRLEREVADARRDRVKADRDLSDARKEVAAAQKAAAEARAATASATVAAAAAGAGAHMDPRMCLVCWEREVDVALQW
jgi:chromosome segregation ATPase